MENENQPKTSPETSETLTEALAPEKATEEKVEAQPESQETAGETAKAKVEQETAITKEALEKAVEEAKATVKGGYEGTVKKMREDITRLQQQYVAAQMQLEERNNAALLEQVKAQGGDINLAQEIINRAKTIAQRERDLAAKEQARLEEHAQIEAVKAELNQAARNKKMLDLIAEYKLPKEAARELATARDSTEMELIAVKTAMKAAKAVKPATKVASEGGTGGDGVDLTKLSRREALKLALENTEIRS